MNDLTRLGNNLERFDFEYLLNRALSKVPSDIDQRKGSIIYDALAPACYELTLMYLELRNFYHAAFIQTTFDNYLDLKVAEQGLMRQQATRAIKLGRFTNYDGDPMAMFLGARFATIHPTDSIIYTVVRNRKEPGTYELECEQSGVVGNDYIGNLLPVDNINGLGSAEMSTLLVPGQNKETDDSLRNRFLNAVNSRAFGGNITQYKKEVGAIEGVGAVQVYPVWRGGGTVKVVILDAGYNTVEQAFIGTVQNLIDPRLEGLGLGTAPIGHKVTISTPEVKLVNVEISIALSGDIGENQVKDNIKLALQDYFLILRRNWDIADELGRYRTIVFNAQIIARLINVSGVGNVTGVSIQGANEYGDLELTQSGLVQHLPVVGEVIIRAN